MEGRIITRVAMDRALIWRSDLRWPHPHTTMGILLHPITMAKNDMPKNSSANKTSYSSI